MQAITIDNALYADALEYAHDKGMSRRDYIMQKYG